MIEGMKKIFLFFLFSFLLLTTIFHQTAFAQNAPFSLTTTPHVFDLTSTPGQTISKTIKVRNNTDTSLSLSVSVKKLIPDQTGQIVIADFSKAEDYSSWLTIDNASVSATPREWVDISFTIKIPSTASYGYYYAVLLSANNKDQTAQEKVTGAIAIPILLDVTKPGTNFTGVLTKFVADSGFYEFLPVTFSTTFQNKGNVHVKPHGNIFITDMAGKQVASLDVNKELGSILPNATRIFQTSWDDSFITNDPKIINDKVVTDSKGNVVYQLNFHFDKVLSLRMGKYTAHELLVVSTDTKDISYEATTTFWIFPWKVIGLLLIIIIFAGVGIFSTAKNLVSKVKKLFKK